MSIVITSLSHAITVQRNGQEITLHQGDSLLASDIVTTQDTVTVITLADGTILSLAPQSSFSIEKVDFVDGQDPLIVIQHNAGIMRVESDHFGIQNAQSFKMISHGIQADIYGTDFISNVLPNGQGEYILLASDKDKDQDTGGALLITAKDGTFVNLSEPLQSLTLQANAALASPQYAQEDYAQQLIDATTPNDEQILNSTSQLNTLSYATLAESLVSQEGFFIDTINLGTSFFTNVNLDRPFVLGSDAFSGLQFRSLAFDNLSTSISASASTSADLGRPFVFGGNALLGPQFTLPPSDNSSDDATQDSFDATQDSVISVDTPDLVISEDAAQPYQVLGLATWTNINSSINAPAFGLTNPSLGPMSTVLAGNYGSMNITADGTYTYTLDAVKAQSLQQGENITETFTIYVETSSGNVLSEEITVTVKGENDAPVIELSVNEISIKESSLELTATGNLTVSDVDADGYSLNEQALSVSHGLQNVSASRPGDDIRIDGTYGTLFINGLTGEYTYTLGYTDEQWRAVQALNDGDSQTEVFTITVRDAHNATGFETITVAIEGSNNVTPVLTVQNLLVAEIFSEGDASSFNSVLDRDTGSNYTLTVGVGSVPSAPIRPTIVPSTTTVDGKYGSLSVASNNQNSYVLDAERAKYIGSHEIVHETFTVYAKDNNNASDAKTLNVEIRGDANSTIGYAETEKLGGLVKDFNSLSNGAIIQEHDGSHDTYGITNIEIEADVDIDVEILGDSASSSAGDKVGGNDNISTWDLSAANAVIVGDMYFIAVGFVAGSDTITVKGNMSGSNVHGDASTINSNGKVTSVDTITVTGIMSDGNIYGDAYLIGDDASITGSDFITIGALSGGNIYGDALTVGNNVSITGSDTIMVNGTMSAGNIYTDAKVINSTDTYDDTDSVTITGGMTGGTIHVSRGTDTITINNSNGGSAHDAVNVDLSIAVDATLILDAGGQSGDRMTFITSSTTHNTTVHIYDANTSTQSTIIVKENGGNVNITSNLYALGSYEIGGVKFKLVTEDTSMPSGILNLDAGSVTFGNDFFSLNVNYDNVNYSIYGDNQTVLGGVGDDDTITLKKNMSNGFISGDTRHLNYSFNPTTETGFITGNDYISILGELSGGAIHGDAVDLRSGHKSVGADTIVIGSGMSGGSIYGDVVSVGAGTTASGSDHITINEGMSGGSIYGDTDGSDGTASGSDTITINGNMSGGLIRGDARSGANDGSILSGHDAIIINGNVTGRAKIAGDANSAGNAALRVTVSGNDTITIYGNVDGASDLHISGDVDDVEGTAATISGNDNITITGEVISGRISGDVMDSGNPSEAGEGGTITGADTINVNILNGAEVYGDALQANGITSITGGDTIIINTMNDGDVYGDTGVLRHSASVSGEDVITINGNMNGGNIYGDVSQIQHTSTSNANDTITIKGNLNGNSQIVGDVFSSHSTGAISGDDTIIIEGNMNGGYIYGDVYFANIAGATITGDDTITIEGNMSGGRINSDVLFNNAGALVSGNDTITVKGIMSYGISTPTIEAGAGNDTIIVGSDNNGATSGRIIGGEGADNITVYVGNTSDSDDITIDATGMLSTGEFIHLHDEGTGEIYVGISGLDKDADYINNTFTFNNVDITSGINDALDNSRSIYINGDLVIHFTI